GGGQRGIDQLGQGREVDVFASAPDGVASAGGGGLGLPGRARGAGGGDPGPSRPEVGGVGRRAGAGERAGGVRNIPRHVLLECDDVVGEVEVRPGAAGDVNGGDVAHGEQ